MYNDNYALHQELAQSKAHGETALAALRAHLAAGQQPVDDAFAAQRLLDVKRKVDALESKLDDLDRAMLMSKQLAPQIRMEQDQKRTLTSKFMTIKTVLIPRGPMRSRSTSSSSARSARRRSPMRRTTRPTRRSARRPT